MLRPLYPALSRLLLATEWLTPTLTWSQTARMEIIFPMSAPGKLISAQSMTRLEGRNLHHSPFIPLSFDCFTPLDNFGHCSADAGLLSHLSCFSGVDESTFCPGCEIPVTATVFVLQNEQVQMMGAIIVEGGSWSSWNLKQSWQCPNLDWSAYYLILWIIWEYPLDHQLP